MWLYLVHENDHASRGGTLRPAVGLFGSIRQLSHYVYVCIPMLTFACPARGTAGLTSVLHQFPGEDFNVVGLVANVLGSRIR